MLSLAIRKNIAQLRYDLELKEIELTTANKPLDMEPNNTSYCYYEAKRKNRVQYIHTVIEGLRLDINHYTEQLKNALMNESVTSS